MLLDVCPAVLQCGILNAHGDGGRGEITTTGPHLHQFLVLTEGWEGDVSAGFVGFVGRHLDDAAGGVELASLGDCVSCALAEIVEEATFGGVIAAEAADGDEVHLLDGVVNVIEAEASMPHRPDGPPTVQRKILRGLHHRLLFSHAHRHGWTPFC